MFSRVVALATCAAASRIQTHTTPDGCSHCTGDESECCVQEDGYPSAVTAVRCFNPVVDTCTQHGRVCPVDAPSECFKHTPRREMPPSGDFFCFNPTTHHCAEGHDVNIPHQSYENILCKIGQVACGLSCMPEGEGVCCHNQWYRNEENKQCCSGRCRRGARCEEFVCATNVQCIAYGHAEFDTTAPVGTPQCHTLYADRDAMNAAMSGWAGNPR